MSEWKGHFVWYELMTTDVAAAKAFYGKVVGWGTQDVQMPGMTYSMFTQGDGQIAGVMDLPKPARDMGVPPNWMGYVAVDDVDATAEQVKRQGGAIHVPPMDIPNIGRFAVIADPQSASIAIFKGTGASPTHPPQPTKPGYVGWHELHAVDWEKAFAFYSPLFGWEKTEAMDTPVGVYQTFKAGDHPVGGMYTKPPAIPVPFWLFYFNVEDIDAATDRAKAGGAEILNGPMQVPGGDWVIQAKDPQGAAFALFGKRK